MADLSGEEKQFVAFWTVIFASAIGFWVVAVRWALDLIRA